mmetsp:Transcript_18416/g.50811  ORF Transcript_18416/g.50811 Transcript_18416/m.50811 type:complete len:115 (+) Transcript_18416:234-578(+)
MTMLLSLNAHGGLVVMCTARHTPLTISRLPVLSRETAASRLTSQLNAHESAHESAQLTSPPLPTALSFLFHFFGRGGGIEARVQSEDWGGGDMFLHPIPTRCVHGLDVNVSEAN